MRGRSAREGFMTEAVFNLKRNRYMDIAPDVARLRDDEKFLWPRVVAWLKTEKGIQASEATIRRAYDHAHPELVAAAVNAGGKIKRGRYSHLGEATFDRIRKLLASGMKIKDVAAEVGCAVTTVRRVWHSICDRQD